MIHAFKQNDIRCKIVPQGATTTPAGVKNLQTYPIIKPNGD